MLPLYGMLADVWVFGRCSYSTTSWLRKQRGNIDPALHAGLFILKPVRASDYGIRGVFPIILVTSSR
jgi:hypothetical protein